MTLLIVGRFVEDWAWSNGRSRWATYTNPNPPSSFCLFSNRCVIETSTNLSMRKSWCRRWRNLVSKSASWFGEGTWRSFMRPERTCCLMKWLSTSIYLVRSWNTGLLVIWMALQLSALRGLVWPRTGSLSSQRRQKVKSLHRCWRHRSILGFTREFRDGCFFHF